MTKAIRKAAKNAGAAAIYGGHPIGCTCAVCTGGPKGRFVVISDLHLHPRAAFAHGDGLLNARLQRTLSVLRASLAAAAGLECPWVFGGDLVHTAGYALNVVLAALAETFGRFPDVPKLVVWGNHDARGVGGKIVLEQTIWAALSRAVPNLTVLDPSLSPPVALAGGLTFSGVGAQPSPALQELPQRSDVGIYHGIVDGSKGPNGHVFLDGFDANLLRAQHKVTIVGDLHHPQCLSTPDSDRVILIPGSPEHHDFGDAGDHGWWVVTVDPVTMQFMPSNSPKFLTVQTAEGVRDDGNFYRVLTSTGAQLPGNAIAVMPTPTVVESRSALRGLTGEQILAAWIQEEPPPPHVQDRVPADQLLALGKQLLSLDDVGQLRHVRLKRIELVDFCSYAEATFEIRDGTWLVLGKGRDYPSNGAGKSTLFEAIFWLLFGRTTKGLSGDEVIRWGTKACRVTAWFDDGSGWLEVTRSRGETSRLIVAEYDKGSSELTDEWEATSVNEMTEKLSRYLGLTPELFQALGYFSQERVLLFASATDGERKEMLADLIGLSAYQAASASAQQRIEQLAHQQAVLVGLQRGTEERLAADRVVAERMREQWRRWVEVAAQRKLDAEMALDVFDGRAAHEFERLMGAALEQLTQTNAQNVLTTRARLEQAEFVLAKPWQPMASAQELHDVREAADVARTALVRRRAEADATDHRLSTLRGRLAATDLQLSQGTCPSCGQSIGPEHRTRCLAPLQADIEELEGKATALIHAEKVALVEASELKLQADACAQGVAAADAFARWSDQRQEAKDGLDQLAEEAARIQEVAREHVTKILDGRRAELKRDVERIAREQNPHQLAEEGAAAGVREAEAKLEACKLEQAQLALQTAMHEYWRRGFSKQGIQSLLMDEVAGAFNATRGAIFPALTQGVYDVQFSTLSRTKAGEQRERTEFKVYEHGALVPYESLSGGQRRRIDVGVMLTLVKAVATWMHAPGALGILVLDEVFGFLDASGAEGLMEALRDVQEVVPAIYAISHDPQLQALFSGTVMVEQDDLGVSHLVEGQ